MKKAFISIAVAVFLASFAAISASAAEAALSDEEMQAIAQDVLEALPRQNLTGLTGYARDMAAAQALQDAGWDVVMEDAQVSLAAVDVDEETEALAYSDLESAAPEMKAKIRAAREKIIWSTSWSADDSIGGFLIKPQTHEVVFSPRFQDLFPGWEVPGSYDKTNAPAEDDVEVGALSVTAEPTRESLVDLVAGGAAAAKNMFVIMFNNSVPLKHPSTTAITPSFYDAPTAEGLNAFMAYANLLVSSANYNLGFTRPNGTSIHYWSGLGLNEPCMVPDVPYSMGYVGTRVSTNSTEGSAWMVVSRENTGS